MPATHPAHESQARTYRIDELVQLVRNGTIRIPEFQRPLRWDQADAVRLFDSILRGFPIGSLLLGRGPASADRVRIGDLTIEADGRPDALWVVDGQQRITALVNALTVASIGVGKFKLVLDLRTRPFTVRAAKAVENDSIPLPVVFDLTKVLNWAREHPEHSELIDDINHVTNTIRNFAVPAYEVHTNDQQVLREIFDRMNNTGKKLTRAEVFSALFPTEHGDGYSITWLQDQAEALGWGHIDESTLLQVFLARRQAEVSREIRLEFDDERRRISHFPEEDQSAAYRGAGEALTQAISFLRDSAHIPHFTFLPYKLILVVTARVFALHPEVGETARNSELLRRWVWRAALRGPGRGGATGTTREYARAIQPDSLDNSLQRLLSINDQPERGAYRPTETFRTNTAETKIALCALWTHGPLNTDLTPLTQEVLSQTIGEDSTPTGVVGRLCADPDVRNNLGNVLLLTEEWPAVLDTSFLASHLVAPEWLELSGRDLVQERLGTVASWVTDFVDRAAGAGLDDAPDLDTLNDDDE